MAINLICPKCATNLSVRSKICKKCSYEFKNGKKYRVIVKDQNGKRISKVLDSISMAKRYESKLKTQAIENKLFGIYKVPIIDEVWERYLTWAKDNKKSWRDDEFRWKHHVEIKFSGKKMDTITAFDVQSVIDEMKSKREYAPATIKHLIVLIRRVFNWAKEMDLYLGDNPALKIKLPKLNNEITECLTKDEISRLLQTLAGWQNQMAALLI
jgi:integrase